MEERREKYPRKEKKCNSVQLVKEERKSPKAPFSEGAAYHPITQITGDGEIHKNGGRSPTIPPVISKEIELNSGKHSFIAGGSTFVVTKRYEFIKVIGQGAYGIVISAHDKLTNTRVAIKKIPNAFADLIDAKRILREIKLLEFFDHENIIALLDLIKPSSRHSYDDIYIIADLMETDLHRVIYSHQSLTDEHIQYFMYQTMRGVLYMHSANIIHRDLKPSNLLLNKNCDLKICDFGLARGYEDEKPAMLTEYVVTRWYRAPEVILNATEYTKAIDIWSLGVVFAELLGRAPLFPGNDYLDQVRRIIAILGTTSPEDMEFIGNEPARNYIRSLPKRDKQIWSNLYPKANPVALDLLSKMLAFNPNKRITVEECLAHPYFKGLHSATEEPLADRKFDWAFDNFEPTKELLQNMVYDLSLHFHPENTHKLHPILQKNTHIQWANRHLF